MSDGGAFDFAAAVLLPPLQAAATISILKYQKDQYDDVADDRIKLMTKAVDNYATSVEACIASGVFGEAFGRVPTAILYEEVNSRDETLTQINTNLEILPEADRQVMAANRLMERNDVARLVALDPRYLCHLEGTSVQISNLLQGKLPVDDVVEILTDGAEQAALTGRVGNTHGRTMRNLGISRLRAQAEGRNESRLHLQSLNSNVSPISRQMHIADYMQTASQRVALALTQNQLIQQSLQNAANAEAAGDPTVFAELQSKLQMINNRLGVEAQKGNMVNQFTPNYAAILQPQIQSITEALMGGDPDPLQKPTASVTNSPSVGEGVTVDRNGK